LIRGLVAVAEFPALQQRVTVSSVVQPERYSDLDGLPEVLARHGLKRWALAPLIQFRRNKPARLHPRLFPAIYDQLPRLIERGEAAGVRVMIDDGLSMLLQADRDGRLADQPVERPATSDIRVLRMRPDGLTVRYSDLLDTNTSRGLHWDGVEDPATFYHRLYAKSPDLTAAYESEASAPKQYLSYSTTSTVSQENSLVVISAAPPDTCLATSSK
jgi:hypothetical protein